MASSIAAASEVGRATVLKVSVSDTWLAPDCQYPDALT